MLLAFTTRSLVRSTHLAPSPIRFTAQFDFAASDRLFLRENTYCIVGYPEMGWSHHPSPHQALALRLGSGLMWWLVLQRCSMHIIQPCLTFSLFPSNKNGWNLTLALGDQNLGRTSVNAPANHPAGDLIKIPGRVDIFVMSPCLFGLASPACRLPGPSDNISINPIPPLVNSLFA